jgi:hypothetical protein
MDPTTLNLFSHAAAAGAGAVASGVSSAASGALNLAIAPITAFLAATLLTITSWVTMLGGMVLNFAVNYTVVNMAQHFSTSGGGIGSAINTTWGAVRDLVNMSFIFILLYTAIMTMFGRADYKKTVVNLVVAAILINFSLFFTKIIIDAANLLTMLFYNAAAPGALADSSFWQTGLSNSITQILGITTIFKLSSPITSSNFLTIGIMGSIVLLICGFIFFAVALMFIIRYVVLVFILILSPLMFLGSILPELGGYAGKWWKALSSQAFFAPIFMLLMWISITVLQSLNLTTDFSAALNTTAASTATAVNGVTSTVGVSPTMASTFINFVIVIVFMIASLLIAKSYSERAGGFVNKMTKTAFGLAGGATMGVAGRFGRKTVGRVGQAVADSNFLKDRASESRLARLALVAGKKTGSASFDARGTIIGKQLDAGKATGKGGYRQSREDLIKGRMQQAQDMEVRYSAGDVEREMEDAGWGKKDNEALGRTPAQIEAGRKMVQGMLDERTKRWNNDIKARFQNNLHNTTWATPNLYTGVSEDMEAARRLRDGQKAKSTKDNLFDILKKTIEEEMPPTPPTPPPPTTP